jgi:hypothetical protein
MTAVEEVGVDAKKVSAPKSLAHLQPQHPTSSYCQKLFLGQPLVLINFEGVQDCGRQIKLFHHYLSTQCHGFIAPCHLLKLFVFA